MIERLNDILRKSIFKSDYLEIHQPNVPIIPLALNTILKMQRSHDSRALNGRAHFLSKEVGRRNISGSTSKENMMLSTPRTISRPLRGSDYEIILPLFMDSIAMKHLPKGGGKDAAKGFLENHLNLFEKYGHSMNICFLKDGETFVGLSGLTPMEEINGQFEVELGYLICRDFWRRGFATELGIAYLHYAKHVLGCTDVISLIPIGHKASEGVALKLGFYFESNVEYMRDEYTLFRKILSPLS